MQRLAVLLVCIVLFFPATAEEGESGGESYLQTPDQIVLLDDVNREAEAWAVCAATGDHINCLVGQEVWLIIL
jgi:hypothetical protein